MTETWAIYSSKRPKQAQAAHADQFDLKDSSVQRERSIRSLGNSLKEGGKRCFNHAFRPSKRSFPGTGECTVHNEHQSDSTLHSNSLPFKSTSPSSSLAVPNENNQVKEDIMMPIHLKTRGLATQMMRTSVHVSQGTSQGRFLSLCRSLVEPITDTGKTNRPMKADKLFPQRQKKFNETKGDVAPMKLTLPTFGPVLTPNHEAQVGVGSRFGRQNTTTNTDASPLPASESGTSWLIPNVANIPHELQEAATEKRSDTMKSISDLAKRTYKATIARDRAAIFSTDDPSESDLASRRFSNDTFHAPSTVVDSVFSRRSSIGSSATSLFSLTGRSYSSHARDGSSLKKYASSSSLRASLGSPGPNQDAIPSNRRLPPLPLPHQGGNTPSPRPNSTWPISPDVDVSLKDRVTLAGIIAQQRRINKGRLPETIQEERRSREIEHPKSNLKFAADVYIEIDADVRRTLDTSLRETVEEIEDHIETNGHDSGDNSIKRPMLVPTTLSSQASRSCSAGTETNTDRSSFSSREVRQDNSTPGTSIAEDLEMDALESDMSEANESMSDVTDETDDSFYEAFATTSLDMNLFPSALALKDHVVTLASSRVLDWVRSCPSGEGSGGASSSPDSPSADSTNGKDQSSSGRDFGGKKREFNGDGRKGFDRENGDDQDKRRRVNSVSTGNGTTRLSPKFACPFIKQDPNKKWPRCQQGWPTVHRIKEHIYKHHGLPIHCDRCFNIFKSEHALKQHNRKDPRCEVIDPPRTLIGLDRDTIQRLRSRKGIQHIAEEVKWEAMYKIIFPHAASVPSPYYNIQMMEAHISPESEARYRRFLRQELPDRVIRSINSNLRHDPAVREYIQDLDRTFSEIITRAVWDAFDDVLPNIPRNAALEPDNNVLQPVRTMAPAQPLSTDNPTPQSTRHENGDGEEGEPSKASTTAQNTAAEEHNEPRHNSLDLFSFSGDGVEETSGVEEDMSLYETAFDDGVSQLHSLLEIPQDTVDRLELISLSLPATDGFDFGFPSS